MVTEPESTDGPSPVCLTEVTDKLPGPMLSQNGMKASRARWTGFFLVALAETATTRSFAYDDSSDLNLRPAWIIEENRLAPTNPVPLNLDLPSVDFGGLRLTISARKAGLPEDPLPNLRYTTADARRQLAKTLATSHQTRLSIQGSLESGPARGLSFALARQNADKGSFLDGRLAFASGDIEASVRMRDVDRSFSRTSLVSDQEWGDAKDLIGWRQTDMLFGWKPSERLNIRTTMVRGKNGDSGESRSRDRVDLSLRPSGRTDIALYTESSVAGRSGARTRAVSRGLTLNQNLGKGAALSVSETVRRTGTDPSTRQSKIAFRTAEKGATFFSAERDEVRNGRTRKMEQRFAFRTALSSALKMESTYLLKGEGPSETRDALLRMRLNIADGWNLDGSLRNKTGIPGLLTDIKLDAAPDPKTKLDGRILRLADGSSPFRSQDILHLERPLDRNTRIVADYLGAVSKTGDTAKVHTVQMVSTTSIGSLTGAWRSGGRDLFPGYSALNLKGETAKKNLSWDLNWKEYTAAAASEKVALSWKIRDGLSMEAGHVRNPEDKNGILLDRQTNMLSMRWDVRDGLRFDIGGGSERNGTNTTRRFDLGLKGRLNHLNHVDMSLSTRDAPGYGAVTAWRFGYRNEVDKDHRVMVNVERQRKPIHNGNDLTARVELIADF